MRLPLVLAFTCVTLAGCISMDANECRAANWYDLGFRDGLSGLQRMDVAYDEHCGKLGTKPDVVAYAKGWQEGMWEFNARKSDSND